MTPDEPAAATGAEGVGSGDRPRVLLVTSDRECRVREYGRMLQAALEAQHLAQVEEFPHPSPDSLFAFLDCPRRYDLIHLYYSQSTHPDWTADHVRRLQQLGYPVVVTQLDTFGGLQADAVCWAGDEVQYRQVYDAAIHHHRQRRRGGLNP